jgi:hypothetical protein
MAVESTEFSAGAVLTGRKRWVALLFLALGVSMIILDATIVNVAIPPWSRTSASPRPTPSG